MSIPKFTTEEKIKIIEAFRSGVITKSHLKPAYHRMLLSGETQAFLLEL